MSYAAPDRQSREERKRIEIMCRVPVSYRVLRGSEVEPPRPARGKWVYELLGGEHREIIERCGDYATEAEARTAAEAILALRRLNTADPNHAKRTAAWINVVKVAERQKAANALAAQREEAAATMRAQEVALAKAHGELKALRAAARKQDAQQAGALKAKLAAAEENAEKLEAMNRAAIAEHEARERQIAEALDRASAEARCKPEYLELLRDGHDLLNNPSSFKSGGSRMPQIYGLHAVEAAGERLDEVRAFRSMQRRGYSKHSPWDQPWPADKTERNKLLTIARAHPRHPWPAQVLAAIRSCVV